MSDSNAVVHIDGASRGNPGPAAYAYVIEIPGQDVIEEANAFGQATNNIAEYTALVQALKRSLAEGLQKLTIKSDSELLVKQMTGLYKVKNTELKDLYEQAKDLCEELENITLIHIRREQNKRADQLCNEALDGLRIATWFEGGTKSTAKPKAKSSSTAKWEQECLEVIEQALKSAISPSSENLWKSIKDVLRKHGILSKSQD